MAKVALVTGAGSGLGFCLARELSREGYDLILVGRDEKKLNVAAEKIHEDVKARKAGRTRHANWVRNTRILLFPCDLARASECRRLKNTLGETPVDVLVNCAGCGVYGDFDESDEEREEEMVKVNALAVHRLMKIFLPAMERRGIGTILNVASSAGLAPGGPHMAAYYATKAYVVSLTRGVEAELRAKKSPVQVIAFCPGPLDTPFFEKAGIHPSAKAHAPEAAAKAAVRALRGKKMVVVPGAQNRMGVLAGRLLPERVVLSANEKIQAAKGRK